MHTTYVCNELGFAGLVIWYSLTYMHIGKSPGKLDICTVDVHTSLRLHDPKDIDLFAVSSSCNYVLFYHLLGYDLTDLPSLWDFQTILSSSIAIGTGSRRDRQQEHTFIPAVVKNQANK